MQHKIWEGKVAEDIELSVWTKAEDGRIVITMTFPPLPLIANPSNLNHLMLKATEAAVEKLAEMFVEKNAEKLLQEAAWNAVSEIVGKAQILTIVTEAVRKALKERAIEKITEKWVKENAEALLANIDPRRLTETLEKEIASRVAELNAKSGEENEIETKSWWQP